MTDHLRPKPPRPTPSELVKRQSDHELKVSDDMKAMAKYAKQREAVDRDLATGLVVLARELGAADRLPVALQELASALPPDAPKAAHKPVHEVAKTSEKTSARSARATYLVLAISVVELAREALPFLRHLFGVQ